MRIIQIFKKDYPNNKKSDFRYESDYYYNINLESIGENKGWSISIEKKRFRTKFKKIATEIVFKDFVSDVEYYIIINDENVELGWFSVAMVKWNNTARLWDINVYEGYRNQGIGQNIMDFTLSRVKEWGCRAIVLECQSSNFPAISFYLKNGFDLTGFDLISYSNQDIEKCEVRLELSKLLFN